MQTVISILAFHFIFQPIGIRTSFTTGDYMLYIISGIAMYITHNSAVMVMVGAEGPASTMLQLAPMNALISIWPSSLRALYTQVIKLSTILLIHHLAINPVGIDHPIATFGIYLVSWFTVVTVGMVLLDLTPWHPGFVGALKIVFAASTCWLQTKCLWQTRCLPPCFLCSTKIHYLTVSIRPGDLCSSTTRRWTPLSPTRWRSQ